MHIALILWHLELLSVFLQCLLKLWTLAKKAQSSGGVLSISIFYIVTTLTHLLLSEISGYKAFLFGI